MASTATGRVALFSIKPQYAEAILKGTKKVEFRRTTLAPDVSHIVIYATTPVQKVIGTFEVDGVDRARPSTLWDTYGGVGGIDRSDYMDYFEGSDSAYAIRVRAPRTWTQPLALADLSPGLRAPQSYQYLRDEALAKVVPLLTGERASLLERLGNALLITVKSVLPGGVRAPVSDADPVLAGRSGTRQPSPQ